MENKQKDKGNMKRIKIVYAFALVCVIGAALISKYAAEKSLGKINGSLEGNYTLTQNQKETTKDKAKLDSGETVRNNVTNVPDTRTETTEKKQLLRKACMQSHIRIIILCRWV